MLPRLDAEETLSAINAQGLAYGSLPRQEARRMKDRLERAARGGRRLKAAKASPGKLAAMGIGVVSAPSTASQEGISDG
jgi:hypothetical protein